MTPNSDNARNHLLAGPLFMLASALLFTLLNIIIKLLGPQFTGWDIGFYRFFGGGLLLITLFNRGGNPFRGHNIRLLTIRGCTGTAAFLALVTAIRLLPVSTAMVLFYSFPAFAAVFSFGLYKEQIAPAAVVCIAGVLTGVAVLLDFNTGDNLVGQFLAVVAAAFAGLTITFIKELRATNGPAVIYLYFCAMGLLVCLPGFLSSPGLPSNPAEWIMCLGIVLTSLPAQLLMKPKQCLVFICWTRALFRACYRTELLLLRVLRRQ